MDASGYHNKNMVVTLVERGGSARSFHTDGHSIGDIVPIVRDNISREARMMTDKAQHYTQSWHGNLPSIAVCDHECL